MISVPLVLVGLALVFLIVHAIGRGPLWPSVLCLVILHLLGLR
jgi:hypothetical protein